MSEQAEIAYLEQKIKRAALNQLMTLIIAVLGGIIFILTYFGISDGAGTWGYVLGGFTAVLGIVGFAVNSFWESKLMRELKVISEKARNMP